MNKFIKLLTMLSFAIPLLSCSNKNITITFSRISDITDYQSVLYSSYETCLQEHLFTKEELAELEEYYFKYIPDVTTEADYCPEGSPNYGYPIFDGFYRLVNKELVLITTSVQFYADTTFYYMRDCR